MPRLVDGRFDIGGDGTAERYSYFAWAVRFLTRRRAGSVPVGWYQQENCEAMDAVERAVSAKTLPQCYAQRVRYRAGRIECQTERGRGWIDCGSPEEILRLYAKRS